MTMSTPRQKQTAPITESDLRKSFEEFMLEHNPERLRNQGAIMDIPYAMLLPNSDDANVTSFRVLLNTRNGNGIVPATLHVTTDQMANYHFEPKSDANCFMDSGKLATCQGVFGHISLDTESRYSLEGHGYSYPDWSTTLTAEQLSARVAEPDERWYQCLVYDVMDAQEEIQKASAEEHARDIRTPIATNNHDTISKQDQPSL